jgi:hypothetical protein
MHHMTLWQDALDLQVHVTAIAVVDAPLLFMLVAAEAAGPARPQRAIVLGHVHVAAHAIARGRLGVTRVIELQVFTRSL